MSKAARISKIEVCSLQQPWKLVGLRFALNQIWGMKLFLITLKTVSLGSGIETKINETHVQTQWLWNTPFQDWNSLWVKALHHASQPSPGHTVIKVVPALQYKLVVWFSEVYDSTIKIHSRLKTGKRQWNLRTLVL